MELKPIGVHVFAVENINFWVKKTTNQKNKQTKYITKQIGLEQKNCTKFKVLDCKRAIFKYSANIVLSSAATFFS